MKSWKEASLKQPIASRMLKKMLIRNRVAHAYLIQGDPGTGKEEIATLFAKSLFCKHLNDGDPCHSCDTCVRIDSGNHPDVHWIKPDGASIKKDQIAHLQKEFTYTGMESNQKVYLISDADLMTINAANRLLKFLEEPSQQTTAILMTENSQSILQTIRSRCQMISLTPLSSQSIQIVLEEEGISQENARLFSVMMPNLEQARSLVQNEWFAEARKLVVQLMHILQTKRDEALLYIQKQWMDHFSNREQLDFGLDLLMYWFKDIIHLQIDQKEMIVFQSYHKELESCMLNWSKSETVQILSFILKAKRQLKQNIHPTLVMEKLTLQMQR